VTVVKAHFDQTQGNLIATNIENLLFYSTFRLKLQEKYKQKNETAVRYTLYLLRYINWTYITVT